MEMRSNTPLTLMTNADTLHGSRPTTPNGMSTSISNGRMTALTEPDSRSHISQRSSKGGGSPYSTRKVYSESNNTHHQSARPVTPSSITQYSDGIYIGSNSRRTPTDTLESSPKKRQKQYINMSQPAVNHGFDQSAEYATLPHAQYQSDSTSAPNVAFINNKSSTSSEGSTRSTQPLHPNQHQAVINNFQQGAPQPQPSIVSNLVNQPQSSPQQSTGQHLSHQMYMDNQPIQQPLLQNQRIMYQQQQQQPIGIPHQQYSTVSGGHPQYVIADQHNTLQYQPSHEYATLPRHTNGVHQEPQQEYSQPQVAGVQHHQLTGQHQPQPLPRSIVPSEIQYQEPISTVASMPPQAAVASRSVTPSSLTFEISMKNSKSTHTLPVKVMNTEL